MNWQEVCSDPRLNDLPYKIEPNERGQILMSPVRLSHSAFQGRIIKYLNQLVAEGEAFPEFVIATKKGTKVADVVWCSDALWRQIKLKHDAESSVAQEICVKCCPPPTRKRRWQRNEGSSSHTARKKFGYAAKMVPCAFLLKIAI